MRHVIRPSELRLSAAVVLNVVAEQTSGLSGADHANLMNEGALLAARRGSDWITRDDREEALPRVMAGPERKSHVITPEERKIVAYRELGQAIVRSGPCSC